MSARPVSRPRPLAIVAALMLPVLVFGVLAAALWQPQDRLGEVRAAIVNNDEPVEIDGSPVPLGRQLAGGLVGGGATDDDDAHEINFAWELTDESRAKDGLADGTYSAIVTIPESFSADAISLTGDAADARRAKIDVTTPPGAPVLDDAFARIIADTAASITGQTLTGTYVDGLLVGFTTVHTELGEAADGAGELADGTSSAADGARELADGTAPLADGATELAGGVSEVAGGARELADGAATAAGGASGLAAGTSQLGAALPALTQGAGRVADGLAESAAGARTLAAGSGEVAAGAREVSDSLPQLTSGARQVADGNRLLADEVGAIQDTLSPALVSIAAGIEQIRTEQLLAADCDEAELTPLCEQIVADFEATFGGLSAALLGADEQVAALALTTDGLATGAAAVADGVDQVDGGARALSGGATALADGAGQLSTGLDQLAPGAQTLFAGTRQLAASAPALISGAGTLAGGVEELADGAGVLADGTGQLESGASALAEGTGVLRSGATELAAGADAIDAGAGELADGLASAVDEVPSYTDDERDTLADIAASPVSAPGIAGLQTGASGPLFAVIALWLGALGIALVFRLVPTAPVSGRRGGVWLAGAALGWPAVAGAGAGVLVGLVLAAAEDPTWWRWFVAALVGAVVGAAFVAVHQALVVVAGRSGALISIVLAVVALAAGLVSAVPPVIATIAGLLPTGPALTALAAIVLPGAGGAAAILGVVAWALLAFLASALVISRRRRVRVADLVEAA